MELALSLIALWCGGYKTENRIQVCRTQMMECLLLGKLATPSKKDENPVVPPSPLEGLRCFQNQKLGYKSHHDESED